jgi:hypothetical protein
VLWLNEQPRVAFVALPHLAFLVAVYALVFWSPPVLLELWENRL